MLSLTLLIYIICVFIMDILNQNLYKNLQMPAKSRKNILDKPILR